MNGHTIYSMASQEKQLKMFALKHGSMLCPKCMGDIKWSCPVEPGSKGMARCTNSAHEYRVLSARDLEYEVICPWRASTVRLEDGDVAVIFS